MDNTEPDHMILPKTHPPMYLMQKYWARKPYNVVSEYIKKYTKEGEIVLDPFCGSGVTISESLLSNRKAVGIDLNPFSIFLTKNTVIPIDINILKSAFEPLKQFIDERCRSFYSINCPYCQNDAEITQIIWKNIEKSNNSDPIERIEEIRITCKQCNLTNHSVKKDGYEAFYKEEFSRSMEINQNFNKIVKQNELEIPEISFQYTKGENFQQIRHFLIQNPKQEEIFTKRNLIILGIIKKAIDELVIEFPSTSSSHLNESDEFIKNKIDLVKESKSIKDLLLLTFTANLGQSSKMVWVISKRKQKKLEKKEVGSWTHHFYWNPDEFFEINPWIGYCTRIRKTIRGKLNLNERIESKKIQNYDLAENFDELNNNFSDNDNSNDKRALLLNISSDKLTLPDESIDYIFTDPPYGDSIQYYELSYLWNCWLGFYSQDSRDSEYKQEIVINRRQKKNLEDYKKGLTGVFSECYRVLKCDKYMTITFHNTDIKVRNALISSVISSGFELSGMIFQMPPRNSLKSYLHYNNSPVGDYFIRFRKISKNFEDFSNLNHNSNKEYTIEDLSGLIKARIIDILSARAEPTPGILLYNLIDEFLIEKKLFPLNNPKKITSIIDNLIDSKFFFVNNLNEWWFGEGKEPKLNIQPLTDRIIDYIDKNLSLECLGSIQTYSDIYNDIYKEFNCFLTPDRKKISKIIDEFVKSKRKN